MKDACFRLDYIDFVSTSKGTRFDSNDCESS